FLKNFCNIFRFRVFLVQVIASVIKQLASALIDDAIYPKVTSKSLRCLHNRLMDGSCREGRITNPAPSPQPPVSSTPPDQAIQPFIEPKPAEENNKQ
ncbi:MAG: hypothetical protein LPH21_13685, partial [Shewanella sp.]|nr:hypothetical protein [Shewanella sp.]MCF1458561.1 hypothetical protein [Shewanella sp.]